MWHRFETFKPVMDPSPERERRVTPMRWPVPLTTSATPEPDPTSPEAEPVDSTCAPRKLFPARFPSIDVARGLIMVLMAIDHASMFWNAGKPKPSMEGAAGLPAVQYADWAQQLTREITHICAPGFQLLAGAGLAIFVLRRQEKRVPGWLINRDIFLRGLALVLCEFVIMYWPYGQIPFAFIVLACIGCNFVLFAGLRFLPVWLIGLLSFANIFITPLYSADHIVRTGLAQYPMNVFLQVAIGAPDGRSFLVIYPILPWISCFGLGWCMGNWYERRTGIHARWLAMAAGLMMAAAFILRWSGGTYADRMPAGDGPVSLQFWALAKYPPSPVFLLATLGLLAMILAALRTLDFRSAMSWWARVLLVYGRAPLFFFVAHFYLFAAYPLLSTDGPGRWGLGTTYLVWLAGSIILYWPCDLYQRARVRYGGVLRYL